MPLLLSLHARKYKDKYYRKALTRELSVCSKIFKTWNYSVIYFWNKTVDANANSEFSLSTMRQWDKERERAGEEKKNTQMACKQSEWEEKKTRFSSTLTTNCIQCSLKGAFGSIFCRLQVVIFIVVNMLTFLFVIPREKKLCMLVGHSIFFACLRERVHFWFWINQKSKSENSCIYNEWTGWK